MELDYKEIEARIKNYWDRNKVYAVDENPSKPKFYVLDMFPYPSGAGLHVGHPLGYVASDIYSRYKRLKGFNVLHPMGYDAFGLPAEQYAIETGTHPAVTTEKAILRYREQLDKIGFSYDWSRMVKTSDPQYYKWTQWIFLKLFNSWYNRSSNKAEPIHTLIDKWKNEGTKLSCGKSWDQCDEKEQQQELMNFRLAYLSFAEVNWCEALGCVLANDEVKDGKSERGGHPVEKRKMRQWFLRITEYSDRLLDGLEKIDWSESLKEQQRYWIGRSEGAMITFALESNENSIEVFTTRPDTIFGATFLVLAPEHDLVAKITTNEQKAEVENYVAYVKSRSDVERQQEKKITGVFTGAYAMHPFTGKRIPVWLAEYVLAGYGTGAIMAVPADDERDKKFAEKFKLEIIDVIDKSAHPGATIEDKVGVMINSGFLNGLEVKDAIQKMISEVESRGIGMRKVNYKQRDAIYSRQRYWGEPIPVRYKVVGEPDSPFGESDDLPFAIDEKELPLVLPEVSSYKPSGDGRAPLANNTDWLKAGYETDTMPGYAGSSWYFLRYMDPHNQNEFASKEKLEYWKQVDLYLGGSEHAVGHLLYSRFWHKFLFDLGYVSTDEPFKKLVNQGMIQGRSAYVYRISFLNAYSGHQEIYFGENMNQQWTNSKPNAREIVQKINTELGLNIEFDKSVSDDGSSLLSKIPVPIEFVNDQDEVDTAAFTKYKSGFEEVIFYTENQPVKALREVEKMSKSKYNVVNPDDVIEKYGADCFRMFEMFLGPIEQSKPWDDKGISGVSNFLRKFFRLFYDEGKQLWNDEEPSPVELKILHKLLKKLEIDIERLSFNTSVSAFMIAVNELSSIPCNKRQILQPMLQALAPFAPFLTEALWQQLGNEGSIHLSQFPAVDEKYLTESSFNYPVSINGKVRANIELPLNLTEEQAKDLILQHEGVSKWLNGSAPKKFIFVKGRIINVVV
ncbi:MAG: class I tRNA ligase family protein [Chitinophagales bacterium]